MASSANPELTTSSPKGVEPSTSSANDSAGAGLQKSLSRNALAPKHSNSGIWTPIGPPTPAGAQTPGVFSFDEPFVGTDGSNSKGVDPEALKEKIDHVHDGGLEGGFHDGEELEEGVHASA